MATATVTVEQRPFQEVHPDNLPDYLRLSEALRGFDLLMRYHFFLRTDTADRKTWVDLITAYITEGEDRFLPKTQNLHDCWPLCGGNPCVLCELKRL